MEDRCAGQPGRAGGRRAVAGPAVSYLQRPDVALRGKTFDFDSRLTQLSASANHFWSAGPLNRVFVSGAVGTSFDDVPLPTDQFSLGTPFRLGAYDAGELRGPHFYVVTGGYLRRVGRLTDFLGGPVFAGGWLENGDAFDVVARGLAYEWRRRALDGHAGWTGRRRRFVELRRTWRTYLAVGRTFR